MSVAMVEKSEVVDVFAQFGGVDVPSLELFTALGGIDKLLSKRVAVPILGGVLIECVDGVLSFEAFDFGTRVRYEVEVRYAVNDAPFRVLVDARALLRVVKTHKRKVGKSVDVSALCVVGGALVVSQGGSCASLPVLALEKWMRGPETPRVVGSVDGGVWCGAVSRTVVAAGRDATLPVLMTVQATLKGGTLELAATDRYRLACERVDALHAVLGEHVWLWDAATCKVLVGTRSKTGKYLGLFGEASRVELLADEQRAAGGRHVGWRACGWTIMQREAEGVFPEWRGLVPDVRNAGHVFEVDRVGLIAAVESAAVACERNTPVRLTFGSLGEVTVSGGSGDAQSSASAVCAVIGEYDGDAGHVVSFNPAFLIDALKSAPGACVRVWGTTARKPHVFFSPECEAWRLLLMHVTVS